MLELAQALANCEQDVFQGWMIAAVDVAIRGSAGHYSNTAVLQRQNRSVLLIQGRDDAGILQKEMKVILLLPKKTEAKNTAAEKAEGKIVAEHIFSEREIADYADYAGDENKIHRQAHPVVPGLLLLSWLQQELKLKKLQWQVKFLQPVYAGDRVFCLDEGSRMTAYVREMKVFVINDKLRG